MNPNTLSPHPLNIHNIFTYEPSYPYPMFLLYYTQSNEFVPERFVDNGKVGYQLANGEIVVRPQYEEGSDFLNGHAIVVKKNRKGIINTFGKILIPLIYEDIRFFKEGLSRVKKNNKYGYVDILNREIIACIYDEAGDFTSGHAPVAIKGKYGFVNTSGIIKIPLLFDQVGDFSEGIAAVRKEGKWSFIDTYGERVIAPDLMNSLSFSDDESLVSRDK